MFRTAVSAAVLLTAAAGCGVGVFDPSDGRLLVVATTGPVGDLVRNLGGDRLRVEVLMGPGVDPHTYNAKPSDMRLLAAADAVFYNGLHLEGKLGDAIAAMAKRKPAVAVAEGLVETRDPRLIRPEGYEGLYDPHVWHDAGLWIECARHCAKRLAEIDPDGAEGYGERLARYAAELEALHAECRERLAATPEASRMLVTAHDAFAYFSRAYGLESVGLKGVSTEDEVDLGQMDRVATMLAERRAPCVFIETAVSPQLVEALIEATADKGHSVRIGGELYADALGPVGSGADNYAGMIRANVETIYRGLTGAGDEDD